ncbi:RNA-splicing ligase RtcB [Prevotella sp. oral taxon 376]|uniref:RtcB family protein n=1 Tax=Prevotella sp. oral taxon 376 TaxID=712466 RepID=UPI000D1F95F5|nr:RtcB family protein [Prevotella sp. oral taxon 376]PTL34554.1 RNA-splicing ligase RtcB [Prevotella sp. oral taxon 376]
MKIIKNSIGNEVKVFAETFENEAYEQVKALADFEPYHNAKIRIMPDSHAGKGCTIGTTMTITDKITPNLTGVDIGCGMLVVELQEQDVDLKELDMVIHKHVPSGFNIHLIPIHSFSFKNLRCAEHVNLERAILSIGSLGGGNHFIEVDRSEDGRLYLVIHSGSRNLGVGVCNYYQNLAYEKLNSLADKKKELIAVLKAQGREKDINSELQKLSQPKFIKELAYLEGKDFEDYINDMEIVQRFASLNRKTIAELILGQMDLHAVSTFETIHNYIDTKNMILRKGAVSAQKGEKFIVPINMRDGSLICIGKGNEDWNHSAPHGAGRLMSRSKAKETVSMNDYEKSMDGIYTTSVNEATIDEAPQVYKPIDEIMKAIEPTADIVEIIKPIYNYKAN